MQHAFEDRPRGYLVIMKPLIQHLRGVATGGNPHADPTGLQKVQSSLCGCFVPVNGAGQLCWTTDVSSLKWERRRRKIEPAHRVSLERRVFWIRTSAFLSQVDGFLPALELCRSQPFLEPPATDVRLKRF